MTAQFLRQASLIVSSDSEQIDLSELRISFQTRQHDVQSPNSCVIRVYNLADETIRKIAGEFKTVLLKAGYGDDSLAMVFAGSILQTKAGRLNASDTYMDLIASDGDEGYNFAVASVTLAAGATPLQQIQAAAAALEPYGISLGYVPSDLPGGALPRGKVMHAMARDVLRQVAAANGLSWSIQGGVLQFVPLTGYIPGEAVVLTAQTGMIGLPEQTENGIKVRCLLNPRIGVGRVVQIDNKSIQRALNTNLSPGGEASFDFLNATVHVTDDGFYKVLVAENSGDTRDTPWYTDIIAIAIDDAAPNTNVAARAF